MGNVEGVKELKSHSWFKGFPIDNILELKPPFVPKLSDPFDTSYFLDGDSNEQKKYSKAGLSRNIRDFAGHNLPFIGYTYLQHSTDHVSKVIPLSTDIFKPKTTALSIAVHFSNADTEASMKCISKSSTAFEIDADPFTLDLQPYGNTQLDDRSIVKPDPVSSAETDRNEEMTSKSELHVPLDESQKEPDQSCTFSDLSALTKSIASVELELVESNEKLFSANAELDNLKSLNSSLQLQIEEKNERISRLEKKILENDSTSQMSSVKLEEKFQTAKGSLRSNSNSELGENALRATISELQQLVEIKDSNIRELECRLFDESARVSVLQNRITDMQSVKTGDFEFDVSYVLKGFLKMPKGGKIKRGWVQKFVILKDARLFVYENEKESEGIGGEFIADLRSSVFIAKSVHQNELIHTSAKQIDCIFKVQSTFACNNENPASELSQVNLAKKINLLQQEIEQEEAMLLGIQKMIQASVGYFPSEEFLRQQESAENKLARLNSEKNRLSECLDPHQLSIEAISLRALEEDIMKAKKIVENQIEVESRKVESLKTILAPDSRLKNPNAKDELTLSEIKLKKLHTDLGLLNEMVPIFSYQVAKLKSMMVAANPWNYHVHK
ncbi:Serine/threonine-protein kinase MRCK beta [Entophlyctis luteolus]|nr:Serine/threonine-protein kinase MRCK beta [Entophlyctis luteolus]